MMRTRAIDPKRTNLLPETGGPLNNEQMAALEAWITQINV
jgi:hypothetical protein